jgi:hypothetical protein
MGIIGENQCKLGALCSLVFGVIPATWDMYYYPPARIRSIESILTDVVGEEPKGIHTATISARKGHLLSHRGKSLDKKLGTGGGLGPGE